jgi:hypothetical protein
MRATITCAACGTVLGVPKAGMPKDGLSCNWCGYVNLPTANPEPNPAPVSAPVPVTSPVAESEPTPVRKAAPHRWADDEDDNGMPYAVPRGEIREKRCQACGKEIDINSVVCVHCGFDAATRKKAERTFEPIDREWETGWSFQVRMALFLVCQALNAITVMVSFAADGSLPTTVFGMVFAVVLQAFVLGTYERLRIRRNKKGQAEITVTWRVCFIPQPPKKLNWREHEGIAFGHYSAVGTTDWIIAFVLIFFFLLPAILFWIYVIRSDRFFAALTRDRGFPETYLYRGMNEKQAKEIAQTATDATGLPLVTPL